MMKRSNTTLRWAFYCWLLCFSSARADERILSWHSEITVRENGSMQVVETIQVNAENRKIKRGIFREFPTRYAADTWRRYLKP